MRPLGLTDTIFYNLGECYVTAVVVLDGPCELARVVAEIEAVIKGLPGWTERPFRFGPWFFASNPTAIDLAEHIGVIRDPSLTGPEDLAPLLDRLRRSPIRRPGPPWRVLVLNPGDGAQPNGGAPPLSALFLQMRHGLADAMRVMNVLVRMTRYNATPAQEALARRLPDIDVESLTGEIPVHDIGLSVLQVPRRGMSRDGEASDRLATAAVAAVAEARLFPHAQPLRGNVGRTKFVRRRGSSNGVGNHLKMVTEKTGHSAKRFHIPGLSRAQDLELTQWLVALAPRRLARLMMRIWYASFDAIATLVPLPRRLVIGGRVVTAMFGVPPLWGPVPLALVAFADGEHYHVTVIPGRGFSADRESLHDRLRSQLNPLAAEAAPRPAAAESEEDGFAEAVPAGRPAYAKR